MDTVPMLMAALRLSLLFCVCLTSGVPVAFAAASQDLVLFVLAGQSNMSGRGAITKLPTGFPRHGSRIEVYGNDARWRPAREPLDGADGQVDSVSADYGAGVGPGLAFADAYAAGHPQARIGLIPCAKGASRIEQWAPAVSRDRLYGSCLARIREATARGSVQGLLWYQGESDTRLLADAKAWSLRFVQLVESFRRDLSSGRLAVVFVRLPQLADDIKTAWGLNFWDELRRAQASTSLPCSAMVEAEPFARSADGIHLSTAGQLELGSALQNRFQQLRTCGYATR